MRCVSASSDPVLRFLVGLDFLDFWICALLGVRLIHLCFSANARQSRVRCADGIGVLSERLLLFRWTYSFETFIGWNTLCSFAGFVFGILPPHFGFG